MILLNKEKGIAKNINNIAASEIYYDENRYTIFVYIDFATKEQIRKIKNEFIKYIDLNNMQETYKSIVVYS